MASTSVKVDEATKVALDDLQAHLTQVLGRKVTQQEVTRALVEEAQRDPGRVVAAFLDTWEGMTPAQVRRFLSRTVAGAPKGATPEDEAIYGQPHGRAGTDKRGVVERS
jgi:hypothetical protein